MRFFEPRPDPRKEWHRWFAWYPVRIAPGDGSSGPVVWLEYVETRRETNSGFYEIAVRNWYRLPGVGGHGSECNCADCNAVMGVGRATR